jgi:hypothetical protein
MKRLKVRHVEAAYWLLAKVLVPGVPCDVAGGHVLGLLTLLDVAAPSH